MRFADGVLFASAARRGLNASTSFIVSSSAVALQAAQEAFRRLEWQIYDVCKGFTEALFTKWDEFHAIQNGATSILRRPFPAGPSGASPRRC
jgi:hypothetical protein